MPTLDIGGYDMAYVEQGAGDPVVLVHGTLQDQRYWAPQMAAFGAKYRVIAVSLRHFWPEKWDGVGDDFTIAQHVADVAAFAEGLNAGPIRLVGHSRGGHIAFRVAQHFPERLRALVLAEPGGELDASFGTVRAAGPQAAVIEAVKLIRAGDVEEALRVFTAYTGGAGSWEKRPESRRQVSRDNARTLLGQINEQRAPFSRAQAEGIHVPTLLVGGALSQPQFGIIMDGMEKSILGVERVTIPDAAHGMSADNPAAFNEAVLAFLDAN